MKSISRFGAAVLALMACPLFALGQGSVTVTASGGAPSPDWAPYGVESDTPLTATTTTPNPGTGQTLVGPTWNWTIIQVETSPDGVNYTVGGCYEGGILTSNTANTALQMWFYEGAYWRVTCRATVGFSAVPGGATWTGSAPCDALPKSGQLISITVSSGATQTNVTGSQNWAAVKQAGSSVVVQATVAPNVTAVANMITWTGGSAVTGTNLQRTVDGGTSAKTAVTAVIGTDATQEVDIWILWASIVNQVTNPKPVNAANFGALLDGTETLGAVDWDMGNQAAGKVCPIGTLTPPGVNAVVQAGWNFRRDKWRHDFKDGARDATRYDTTWQGDDSDADFLKLVPDNADKIYDLDGPNIGDFGQTDSYERYDNYRQYIQWNGTLCGDYAGWYWKARWKANCCMTNQVTLKEVAAGALDLSMYTTAFYPAP